MICAAKFELSYYDVNGYMNMIISSDLESINVISAEKVIVNINVSLPGRLMLTIDGKNSDTDTIINDNGDIIKDKHIYIDNISLDHYDFPEKIRQHTLVLKNKTQHNVGPYLGFNGEMQIDFTENDAFTQHIIHKNAFFNGIT